MRATLGRFLGVGARNFSFAGEGLWAPKTESRSRACKGFLPRIMNVAATVKAFMHVGAIRAEFAKPVGKVLRRRISVLKRVPLPEVCGGLCASPFGKGAVRGAAGSTMNEAVFWRQINIFA